MPQEEISYSKNLKFKPSLLHAKEHFPVIQPAIVIRVSVNLAEQLKRHLIEGLRFIMNKTLRHNMKCLMLTFPPFAFRFVSLMLMCLSMLVSPLDMRTACQSVRAPRATPTVLKRQNTFH